MAGNQDDNDRHDVNAEDTERRRLENFQAMRVKTAAELARLEKKRSDTRLNIGVTPERMQQV